MFQELDRESVLALLPDRAATAQKGDFGRLLLLCGARGYTGAAALAAMGALRAGAGLVFLGVPESIYAIEAVKLTEPVVFPLPEQDGMLSTQAIASIRERLPAMNAVLLGPGLGQSPGTRQVVETVLAEAACPVVLDADGINLVSGHISLLRERTFPTIVTPHEGEFRRLWPQEETSRQAGSIQAAKDLGIILVRKGHHTIITDGTHTYRNSTGNPGMAVGGSGDVLAGMITGLLGQGLSPLDAAACGVWLHGAAGDLCAREMGQYAMLPTDMLACLSRLLK